MYGKKFPDYGTKSALGNLAAMCSEMTRTLNGTVEVRKTNRPCKEGRMLPFKELWPSQEVIHLLKNLVHPVYEPETRRNAFD